MEPLDPAECLRLAGSVPFGRIVFTQRALPAIRPVNHVVVDGAVVIRTNEGSALTIAAQNPDTRGVVVAFEADAIDPVDRLGWSIVVTGFAELVTDPAEIRRYSRQVHPWIEGTMDSVVRIRPDLVTGFRLTAD
ncbi:pyridoxamine 5'-phosphate oxidase family protein [Kitasatospora terrestris]